MNNFYQVNHDVSSTAIEGTRLTSVFPGNHHNHDARLSGRSAATWIPPRSTQGVEPTSVSPF
jgi:hypothetical protein